jgi:hypothetical protein
MNLLEAFTSDPQGKKFADLYGEEIFPRLIEFFADPDRQRRMIESEKHHRRPALAGVVVELERELFPHQPKTRVRQCVGVLVRIVMGQHNWRPARERGSLTARKLSLWFKRSEHYVDVLEALTPEATDLATRGRFAQKLRARVEALQMSQQKRHEWLERISKAKKSNKLLKQLAKDLHEA